MRGDFVVDCLLVASGVTLVDCVLLKGSRIQGTGDTEGVYVPGIIDNGLKLVGSLEQHLLMLGTYGVVDS